MKLLKYMIVSIHNGKWDWNEEVEHHSIAVPKMLNSLDLRCKKIVTDVSSLIKAAMFESPNNRKFSSNLIHEKISDFKEELSLHFYMLSEFKRKVIKNMEEGKTSPIMNLKTMESPLRRRRQKSSISHMYERLDNSEIEPKLESAFFDLNGTIDDLKLTEVCYLELINIENLDGEILLENLRKLKEKLDMLRSEELFNAFFVFDDATRGLIQRTVSVRVNLSDTANKLGDLILRTLLKGINKYSKSEESRLVDKAIDRLRELNLDVNDMNIESLLKVRTLLDLQPNKKPSYDICYKKIGEFHASINQKMFELTGLHYLRKYFPVNLIFLVDVVRNELDSLHNKFIQLHLEGHKGEKSEKGGLKNEKGDLKEREEKEKNEKGIQELEFSAKVLKELLLECDESHLGKTYFFINNKIHSINSSIAAKYYILDEEKLFKCFDMLGSKELRNFISSCKTLMVELKKELEVNLEDVNIDLEDVNNVNTEDSGDKDLEDVNNVDDSENVNNLEKEEEKEGKNGKEEKEKKEVAKEDLHKVGITTGKTSMITSYNKAIEEILASLGTFLANTLHVLIKEILNNIVDEKIRKSLIKTYEETETILKEFNNY